MKISLLGPSLVLSSGASAEEAPPKPQSLPVHTAAKVSRPQCPRNNDGDPSLCLQSTVDAYGGNQHLDPHNTQECNTSWEHYTALAPWPRKGAEWTPIPEGEKPTSEAAQAYLRARLCAGNSEGLNTVPRLWWLALRFLPQ